MEAVPASLYRAMRGYWRKRRYERLAGPGSRREGRADLDPPAPRRWRLRGRRWRRRSRWRVRLTPRVKLRRLAASPRRFFLWLRDAYVKMMLGFASSAALGGGFGYGHGGAEATPGPRGSGGPRRRSTTGRCWWRSTSRCWWRRASSRRRWKPGGSAPRSLADG
ncbi:hypothetical protein NL676_002478 [Syzygium grande]|nr:hypothetical protein NL676_002478 [Syzygium grande]